MKPPVWVYNTIADLNLWLESPKFNVICKKKVMAKKACSYISHFLVRLKVTQKNKLIGKAKKKKKWPFKDVFFQSSTRLVFN